MSAEGEPFFIGWARAPRRLAVFLGACAGALVVTFAAAAYLIASTADDPGDGALRGDWGPVAVVGRLEAAPYPVLHVTEAGRFAAGRAVMLSGGGKTGVQDRAAALDGRLVRATGIALTRGDLVMLQLDGAAQALIDMGAGGAAEEPRRLGRWRVTGEICDGKCYAGAMRPGDGLAHRACAELCIDSGLPPVFVATGPIEGRSFFLIGSADGGPMPEALRDWIALPVEIEAEVERRGDMPVLLVASDAVRAAR